MKKYTVEWHGKGLTPHIHTYLSKDEQHAYTQAIEDHTYSEYQNMVIFSKVPGRGRLTLKNIPI